LIFDEVTNKNKLTAFLWLTLCKPCMSMIHGANTERCVGLLLLTIFPMDWLFVMFNCTCRCRSL